MKESFADIAAVTSKKTTRTWTVVFCPWCAGAIMIETNAQNASPPEELTVVPTEPHDLTVDHLPDDVRAYYSDAIRVMDAGVPDAAAVQLRRTLEAAAQHFDVKPFPLDKAVKELIGEQLITSQFGEVLHAVRKVGNMGAHASDDRVDEETARRVLRFTTQVLRNLFEIPAELEQLRAEDPPNETSE